jgi:two-component system catabolic regulation response regulator CreB
VLVVDDQHYVRILLKDNLEFDDFDTRCATKGREALEIAKTFKPDLAIVDVGLPDMSGLEVCRQLRERHPGMEVVVLSAMDADPIRAQMTQLGLEHFVAKPYDPIAFSDLVKRLLRA